MSLAIYLLLGPRTLLGMCICTRGQTALCISSFSVSLSVTLANELRLAATVAMCECASQALSNTPMMSSSSSFFCCFSGSFWMKSHPIRTSSSGEEMSTPPFVMCCQRYMPTVSMIDQIMTSGSVSLMLSQFLTISFWKLLIMVGMASLWSACRSLDWLSKIFVIFQHTPLPL